MLLTTATAWAKTIPSMHADATYESISRRVFNPSASLPETIQYGGVTYQYHREDVQWSGTNGDISFSNDFEVSAMYYSDEDFASDRVITLTLEVKGTLFVDGREIAISPSYYGTDGDATEFSFGSFVDNTDKHFETLGVSANAYNRDWLLDDPTRTYWLLYAIAMQYTENHPGEYVIFRGSEIPPSVTRDGAGFNMSHVAYQNELFYLYEAETGKYYPVWSCHIIPPKQQDPTSTNSVGTFSLVYTNPKTTYLITAVPENAFSGNDHVIDVTLDENINAIHASLSSTKIKSFNVDANNHKYTTLFDNDILCEKDADGNPTRIVGVTIDAAGEKTLPASINTIAEHSLHPSATGIKLSTTNANLVCYDDAFQTWTPGEAADANSIKKYRYITLGNGVTVSGDGVTTEGNTITSVTEQTVTVTGTIPAGYEINFLVKDANDNTIPVNNDNGVFSFTMPSSDVTVSATFTPDPAHIEQTATDEYTIHSAEGWGVFCDMLQDNANYNRFIGKTVKLDANIGTAENPITRMAGSSGHEFFGTFDGQQHTLTFSYGATGAYGNEQYVAPFRYVSGDNEQNPAIIQNLHVTGHIYTSTKYATGILAQQNGTVKIKNCHSSIVIHSSVSGDGSHGGLVGGISGTLSIDGCVFDGKLLTTGTTATNNCGGFVGWNGGTLTISNSLYEPAIIDTEHGEKEVVVGTSYPSATFSRNGATITNSYYTRTLGTAQGKAARSITAGEYVTIEAVSPIGSSVEDGTYTVSGITAYAKGITRGDAFYYGNGDEASLTLSHADRGGYTFTGYTASAGTLDGTTLTMPGDGDVTINANYEFIKFTQGALSYECTSGTEVKVTACDKSATSVTIPTSVTDNNVTYSVTAIAADAFNDCTALTTVFMESTTPPTLGNDAFANCNELANIYVPAGTSGAYKTAWADYASKIEDYGSCGENVNWSYNSDSKTLTIFGTGAMADYNSCPCPWDNYCEEITTVDIRDGVTTIGDYAFTGCYALSSIDIPASVTTIGEQAFASCSGLTNIEIPASVTNIGDLAFAYCTGLTSIEIPASVTTISDDAFNGCTGLSAFTVDNGNTAYASEDGVLFNKAKTTLIKYPTGNSRTSYAIPNSVTTIGDGAFSDCTGLTSIDIPASVTTIGNGAFLDCTGLTSIDIPASVTTIGNGAFLDCTGLTRIVISYGVTSIGESAFGFCTGLTSIDIPASVTNIGDLAFHLCNKLTTVIVQPTTPPSLGDDAFYDCDALANIYVPAGTSGDYKAAWSDYASKIEDYGSCGENVNWSYNSESKTLTIFGTGAMADNMFGKWPWSSFKKEITTVDIRDGVTTIGDQAFSGCTSLTSITIPAGVTSIGDFAFSSCTALSSIELPTSLTSICKGTFNTCKSLTSITIPAGVTSISDNAFQSCTALTSIDLPASLTTIGNLAFSFCSSLSSIELPTSLTTICEKAFEACKGLTSITIPDGVTSISYMAFYKCTALTSITIPASVTSIGKEAFINCIGLESISVAAGNTIYDSRNGCNALIETASNTLMLGCKNTVIPNTVTSIGDNAFDGCEELKEITIPASVTSIGNYAFYGCSALESISVADGNTKYDSRNGCNALIETASNTLMLGCMNTVIPNSVTSIGGKAFAYCDALTSITIPSSVTTIGDCAFQGCWGLTSIEIPASVTSIGYAAFITCIYLTSINIPASVTSIGDCAFANCTGLTTVIVQPTTPPTLGYYAFDECDELDAIYVPAGTSGDYKAAWKDYAEKIKGLDEITEIALVDKGDNSGLITAVNGVTLDVYLGSHTVWKDGDWNTLCLPFDVNITSGPLSGDNVLAMTLDKETSGLSGTTLTLNFTKATTIPAGTPFIIKWDNMHVIYHLSTFSDVKIDATDRSVTSADGYVTFKGTYDRLEWNTENNSILFLGTKNTLYWPQPSNNQYPFINACRAYFQLNKGLTVDIVSTARMNFEDGEATGIKTTNSTNYTNSDAWYTLDGRKLEGKPSAKGVYIHNRHKVMVK